MWSKQVYTDFVRKIKKKALTADHVAMRAFNELN